MDTHKGNRIVNNIINNVVTDILNNISRNNRHVEPQITTPIKPKVIEEVASESSDYKISNIFGSDDESD